MCASITITGISLLMFQVKNMSKLEEGNLSIAEYAKCHTGGHNKYQDNKKLNIDLQKTTK